MFSVSLYIFGIIGYLKVWEDSPIKLSDLCILHGKIYFNNQFHFFTGDKTLSSYISFCNLYLYWSHIYVYCHNLLSQISFDSFSLSLFWLALHLHKVTPSLLNIDEMPHCVKWGLVSYVAANDQMIQFGSSGSKLLRIKP